MVTSVDGPHTSRFTPLRLNGNAELTDLSEFGVSPEMVAALDRAPRGNCVGWGVPFDVGRVVALADAPVHVDLTVSAHHRSDDEILRSRVHGGLEEVDLPI